MQDEIKAKNNFTLFFSGSKITVNFPNNKVSVYPKYQNQNAIFLQKIENNNPVFDNFLDEDNFYVKFNISEYQYNHLNALLGFPFQNGIRLFYNNNIYILKILFQFIEYPPTITERIVSYSSKDVIGRFEPYRIWQSGSPLKITLKFSYVAINEELNEIWVSQMVDLWRSIPLMYPPPIMVLKLGGLVDRIPVILTGLARTLDAKHGVSLPYDKTYEEIYNSYRRKIKIGLDKYNIKNKDNIIKDFDSSKDYLPKIQELEASFESYYTNKWIGSETIIKKNENKDLY
jgi:hypothetical protein